MPLISVSNEASWDAFMGSQPRAQFTQSWAWGMFRASRGQAIERLALVDDAGTWEAAALFAHTPTPLVGGYWYAPRGPVLRADTATNAADALKRFMDAVASRGLTRRALFWRIEPPVVADVLDPAALHGVLPSLVRSHAYMPASTLLIDLNAAEEDLLKCMHEKTRYNIRVAERHGVTVRVATEPDAIDAFLRLNDETAQRDGFTSQPSAYIRATYDALAPHGMAQWRFAEKDGALLAASLEIRFGDTVTYVYGASSSASRNAMAPYALHWDAVRSAKAGGFHWYDLHGVNPANTASPYYKKNWEGITRFKTGWGGERADYVGTWELPRMPMAYRLFRLIRNG